MIEQQKWEHEHGITMEIALLHGIFFNTIQLFNMICCLCIGFAGPLFGATLLLWKPCFFPACRVWKNGKDILR
jgi:hypothetical protein